jgi:hypothetical protein
LLFCLSSESFPQSCHRESLFVICSTHYIDKAIYAKDVANDADHVSKGVLDAEVKTYSLTHSFNYILTYLLKV